jgi:hypothetical protein
MLHGILKRMRQLPSVSPQFERLDALELVETSGAPGETISELLALAPTTELCFSRWASCG